MRRLTNRRVPDPDQPIDVMRRLLCGDVALADWGPGDPDFAAVRDALAAGDAAAARSRLRAVLSAENRASRDLLQAWHCLRALGEAPDEPGRLYGVVVDMPVGRRGLDTLAAYEDGTCRYLNHSGKVLVWEAEDAEVDGLVRRVLEIGRVIVLRIGPWNGARPPLRPGTLRVSMLCAGGLYFGEGPASALSGDPMAGPLVLAATRLLQKLVEKAEARSAGVELA